MSWADRRFERDLLDRSVDPARADVSIEVAHVSASLMGSVAARREIDACIRRYRHVLKSREYGDSHDVISTVCLVDDYNYVRPRNFWSRVSRHIDYLDSNGCVVDYVVFEADLEPLVREFLAFSRDRSVLRYIRKHRRSPCSAHIAAWYLMRLGLLSSKLPAYRRIGVAQKCFFARQLLSILPRYYDTFEERAGVLLGALTARRVLKNVNHGYFEAEPPEGLEYVEDVR